MPVKNSTPVDPQKTNSQQPSALPQKEVEPVTVDAQPSEVVVPKEKEVAPEVVEYLKQRDHAINIPKDLKDLGVSSNEDSPVSKDGPTLSISDEKIEEGLHQPVISSWRWLAEFLVRILKQAHIGLKVIHGHVKRVFVS